VEKIWKKMEKWGLGKERLQLEWISAAEGIRFSQVMAKMEDLRKGVTKQEIAETKKILKRELKKKRKKAAPRGENQQELGKESEGRVL
jgi:heterodisulfide reductase subunit A